jgi:hypothetical protein
MALKTIDIKAEVRAMRWPELIKAHKTYDDLCFGPNACSGRIDMEYLQAIEQEIDRRMEQRDIPGFR